MDIEKTKEYYAGMRREDCCTCAYCQNYIDEVKAAYPELDAYLQSLGVDIERPFELFIPLEEDDGQNFLFYGVQYLICGTSDSSVEKEIGDNVIQITTDHPTPTYEGECFIIDCAPIKVKIRRDKYDF